MIKGLKTKPVVRSNYKNYLVKAEEFYQSMLDNYGKGRWTACVTTAIHCAICGCDALTTFYLGFRHAGDRHHDAIALLKQTSIDRKEIEEKQKHFHLLIDIKTLAEYEDRLMDKTDADNAKKACERFYRWVKEKLHVR